MERDIRSEQGRDEICSAWIIYFNAASARMDKVRDKFNAAVVKTQGKDENENRH